MELKTMDEFIIKLMSLGYDKESACNITVQYFSKGLLDNLEEKIKKEEELSNV